MVANGVSILHFCIVDLDQRTNVDPEQVGNRCGSNISNYLQTF